jgi:endonuclease YncB( thermonuclease family)
MSEVVKPAGFVWTYPAKIDDFHDGDTAICHILIHPNEGGELHEIHVRTEGINAPELNTAAGREAREYARALAIEHGTDVVLVARKREKYGRFLSRIVFPDGSDFSELMVAAGHAVPYLA